MCFQSLIENLIQGRGIVSPSPGSRVGGDLGEDSETEAVWSDGDLNIIGGS